MASLTIRNILEQARMQLATALGLPSNESRLEAQILLQHCLSVNRAWLLTHENDALEVNKHKDFQTLLNRRLQGEPIAYILGKREFYGLEFNVTPDTLIPRSDTETLVEAALEKIPQGQPYRILDLGTGTGAIAISIAKHRPLSQVTAVDASSAALAVAKENAKNLGIDNMKLVSSNWFDALQAQTFHIVVSNPPYIAESDLHLDQGDLRFEPMRALASGSDGLTDIKRIISQAPRYLEPQGWLMIEHGYDQAEKVAYLMQYAGFGSIYSIVDLSGIFRVTQSQYLP